MFRAMQGKRLRRSLGNHGSEEFRRRLLLMAILLEPLQHLGYFFLDSSRDARGAGCGQYPYLMTALLPPQSRLYIVSQYIACLACGPFDQPASRTTLY